MPVIESSGVEIEIDEEGYLLDFDEWDEKVACVLAEREGIEELTKDKLDILKFIRSYYEDYGSYPVFGAVCLNVRQPKTCVTEKFIDPIKTWKIAGIPNPGVEVATYLHHEVV
jgi:tRNA 2-thiouridine synthesizing protein E